MRSNLNKELFSGIFLFLSALLAILFANHTSLLAFYTHFKSSIFAMGFPSYFYLEKPILFWINDGLMVLFFLMVSLEIKREMITGELSEKSNIILPVWAALGGVIIPALFYIGFNWNDESALRGWAIPVATDIAFVLGILALLGKAVPTGLRLFLLSLAIFDDIAAIIIIAIFYTHTLSFSMLFLASLCTITLLLFNIYKIKSLIPYFIVAIIMWLFVLKSGVHPTLVGVIVGLLIPDHISPKHPISLSHRCENTLIPWVYFFILPIFAFANSGIMLNNATIDVLFSSITLGIFVGLFIGKQLGIFLFSYIAIRLHLAKLPSHTSWLALYGGAILCGIGFTMSLFISSLSFSEIDSNWNQDKMGIFLGSFISAIIGAFVIYGSSYKKNISH